MFMLLNMCNVGCCQYDYTLCFRQHLSKRTKMCKQYTHTLMNTKEIILII